MYLIVFLSVPLVSVLICIKLIEKKAEKKHEAFLQVVSHDEQQRKGNAYSCKRNI